MRHSLWVSLIVFVLLAVFLLPAADCGSGDQEEQTPPPRADDDDDNDYFPPDDDDDDASPDDDDDTSPTDDDTGDDDDDDDDDDNDDDDDDNDDDDDDNNDDNNDDDTTPVPDDMIVDTGHGYTDVALDASANPHIVFFRQFQGLQHAAWTGSDWQVESVDSTSLQTGYHAAIAFDPAGALAYAAYQDFAALTLRTAWQDAKGWQNELVDDSAEVGAWSDIVVDGDGYRYISYQDATSGDLKFARHVGSGWETEIVDDGEDRGRFTSLARDDSGVFYISYYDGIASSLKLATGSFGAWTIATIDTPGEEGQDPGRWTSIAVDTAVHIAYQDAGLLDLKYASNQSGDWVVQTVHAIGNKGADACLALNPVNGFASIAYQDGSSLSLRQARWDGSQWQRSVIMDGELFEGSFGFWIGCAMKPAGAGLVISHHYPSEDYVMVYPAHP
jgi:hypothetical protein